jgi:hypothetical protein
VCVCVCVCTRARVCVRVSVRERVCLAICNYEFIHTWRLTRGADSPSCGDKSNYRSKQLNTKGGALEHVLRVQQANIQV